jgi:hypothetical protein
MAVALLPCSQQLAETGEREREEETEGERQISLYKNVEYLKFHYTIIYHSSRVI